MARHGIGKSSQPVRESWSSRALKIAAKYLEDPQKWAAQDKFGKGLTVCQREIDPGFLVGDASGKRMGGAAAASALCMSISLLCTRFFPQGPRRAGLAIHAELFA